MLAVFIVKVGTKKMASVIFQDGIKADNIASMFVLPCKVVL